MKMRTALASLAFVALGNLSLPLVARAQPPGSPADGPQAADTPPGAQPGTAPGSEKPATPVDKPSAEQGDKDGEGAEPDTENTAAELRPSRQGLGMDPGALNFGDLVLPPPPGSQVTPGSLKEYQLNFHGYLRAPMLIGWASGDKQPAGVSEGIKLHSPPRIPDAAYTDWRYTNNLGGPWTELMFTYGNSRVFGTVQIASYNLSDASYKDLTAQLGINQAWLTVNLDDLFGDRGGIRWNIGGFSDGYGRSGRYDAGQYGTYIFGRTHATGETLSAFYDVSDSLTVQFEHGVGARLAAFPFTPNGPMASYLPYGGPKQQLPTMLHHAHLGFTWADKLQFAAHYMTTWTQSQELPNEPDGRISTYGAELRLINSRFGFGWLGYSRLTAKDAIWVGGALQAIHSQEGWNLAENYFGEPELTTPKGSAAAGNGDIDTVSAEYTFSLATFMRYPEAFWGQGPDVLVSVYGMFNKIHPKGPSMSSVPFPTAKLKTGAEITYTPLYWLGAGLRVDLVQPNMDDSRESFQAFSPRLLFRTEFVSHEQIILQYTRYHLGQRTKLSYPYDSMKFNPDPNVLSLIATLWW
jgi:hypothetical protein